MSRKDYVTLAAILASHRKAIQDNSPSIHSPPNGDAAIALLNNTVKAIAAELKRDNDRFNFDRFYAACGLTKGEF